MTTAGRACCGSAPAIGTDFGRGPSATALNCDRRSHRRLQFMHSLLLLALAIPWVPLKVLVGSLLVVGLAFPVISARGPQNAWGRGDPNATIVRGRVVPRLLLGMVYHLEHHLYPEVPTYQLAELSRRLDPWLAANGVNCVRVW